MRLGWLYCTKQGLAKVAFALKVKRMALSQNQVFKKLWREIFYLVIGIHSNPFQYFVGLKKVFKNKIK